MPLCSERNFVDSMYVCIKSEGSCPKHPPLYIHKKPCAWSVTADGTYTQLPDSPTTPTMLMLLALSNVVVSDVYQEQQEQERRKHILDQIMTVEARLRLSNIGECSKVVPRQRTC